MVLIDISFENGIDLDNVSVPLRGLWFLSMASGRTKKFIPPCFRPLAGIMVLIKKWDIKQYPYMTNSFRPLAGIMVLIDIAKGVYISAMLEVSVPLRGLWFLSRTHVKGEIIMMKQVSVPLRGLWFLSSHCCSRSFS